MNELMLLGGYDKTRPVVAIAGDHAMRFGGQRSHLAVYLLRPAEVGAGCNLHIGNSDIDFGNEPVAFGGVLVI